MSAALTFTLVRLACGCRRPSPGLQPPPALTHRPPAVCALSQAARPAAFTSQQQRGARRGGRRLQRCLAMAAEEEKNLDFTNNKNAVSGAGRRARQAASCPAGRRTGCLAGRVHAAAAPCKARRRVNCPALPPPLPHPQALGFTESDSAGQTNIFAVEPKAYVAGGSDDKTASGGQVRAGWPGWLVPGLAPLCARL